MCLLVVAWRAHPRYRAVVAANRDEFHARPTAPMARWPDAPPILAGRDLQAGGTWLGLDSRRRFGLVTNFRELARPRHTAPSRGRLVPGFLASPLSAPTYLDTLETDAQGYAGFNLLLGDGEQLFYASNRAERFARPLEPGLHGLSNHLLDTPWPKVARGKSALTVALQALPDEAALFALLRDDRVAPDEALPRTGISLEWERLLSAAFVRMPGYGTRSSTVLLMDRQARLRFVEQSYLADGAVGERVEKALAVALP